MKIGLVGSFSPTKDGIADHNEELYQAFEQGQDLTIIKMPEAFNWHSHQIDELKLDVVHLQLGNSYSNSYVFKAFRLLEKKNIKLVVTLHDSTNTNAAKLLRTLTNAPGKLVYEINKPSMSDIIRRADRVIVYSSFLKAQLLKNGDIKDNKVVVLRHGGKQRTSGTRQYRMPRVGRGLTIASFGYITPRKGYEDVLNALGRIKRDDLDFTYLIVGQFNFFHYKPILNRLIGKLVLKDRIVFPGYLPLPEAEALLQQADILIIPRKYSYEGASGSLLRALFSGRPIISAHIGGFSEYITDHKTGILVDHSAEGYYSGLVELMKSKDLRESLGRESLNWAIKNLSWSTIASEHVKVYGEVLHG